MKSIIGIALLAAVPLAACHKEEVDEEYCLKDSYSIPFEVTVRLDDSFREYLTIDSLFQTRSPDAPYLKYYVAAFPMTAGLPKVVTSSVDSIIPIKIHPGRYTMVGWVMYESDTKSRGYNFYDDDFTELLLKNKYNYVGGEDVFKIGYWASDPKNIAYNATGTSLLAKPAMGHYRIVATDTATFNPDKVLIRYSSMLPAAIHSKTGEINWWWSDISYHSTVTRLDTIGDLLASDLVLSQNDRETSATVVVEIYDDEGKLRARKKNVEIPLINGGVTTIKGNFYSVLDLDKDGNAGSGISIKTEWDASFDIEF